MRREIMMALLLASACGATGCARGTMVECESVCAERNLTCGVDQASCLTTCRSAQSLAVRRGCEGQLNASLDCVMREADVCDDSIATLCEPEDAALSSCLRQSCGATPLEDDCIEGCTALCQDRADSCGGDYFACAGSCQSEAAAVATTGCGTQYWSYLDCLARHPLGTCTDAGALAACGPEQSALGTCLGTTPSTPTTREPPAAQATMYEECDLVAGCASGTCTTVSTSSTRGEMCTQSCTTAADCPERDVACVANGSGPRYCYRRCYYDSDCPYGMYCEYVSDPYSYDSDYVCVPDL